MVRDDVRASLAKCDWLGIILWYGVDPVQSPFIYLLTLDESLLLYYLSLMDYTRPRQFLIFCPRMDSLPMKSQEVEASSSDFRASGFGYLSAIWDDINNNT